MIYEIQKKNYGEGLRIIQKEAKLSEYLIGTRTI